jgi:hypothetical protein
VTPRALLLAALLSVGLAGCERTSEGIPDAQGSRGTGNPREVVQPSAPDTPPRGSAGDPVPGATGSGTSDAGGRSQTPQSGTGLAGGMGGPSSLGMTGTFPSGTATQSQGEGEAAAGSGNRTPAGGVGMR